MNYLTQAKALYTLLEDPQRWTTGAAARYRPSPLGEKEVYSRGTEVSPHDPQANCWCIVGGFYKVLDKPWVLAADDQPYFDWLDDDPVVQAFVAFTKKYHAVLPPFPAIGGTYGLIYNINDAYRWANPFERFMLSKHAQVKALLGAWVAHLEASGV